MAKGMTAFGDISFDGCGSVDTGLQTLNDAKVAERNRAIAER